MKVLVYTVFIAHLEVQVEIFNETEPSFDQIIDQQGILLGKGAEGCIFKIPTL